MAKILDNISVLAENEGITIGALERKIGASKGVLSRAITNGTDIQAKWITAIVENNPLVSAQWLLTGEGEMLRNEGDEKALCHQNSQESPIIGHFLNTIKEQAEEIGRLKARIEELERAKGDNAGYAPSSAIADAG